MPSFTHTCPVRVPSARLWSLVSDATRVAGLFPYIQVSDVTSPEPNCWLFQRQMTIPNIADLRWREEARITTEGILAFRAVEGDLKTFHGQWQVSPDGQMSSLTLNLEYAIPENLTPSIPAPLVGYVMGELFKKICERICEAVEKEVA